MKSFILYTYWDMYIFMGRAAILISTDEVS